LKGKLVEREKVLKGKSDEKKVIKKKSVKSRELKLN